MGTYKWDEFGKALGKAKREKGGVTIETMRADLETIKAFIAENTCFVVASALLSQEESKITLRTRVK